MLPKLEEVEALDPKWNDPQLLCSTNTSSVIGGAGPFGLLLMASQDLTEQTAVFFRVFKDNHNHQFVVLMCSDQSRFILIISYILFMHFLLLVDDPYLIFFRFELFQVFPETRN